VTIDSVPSSNMALSPRIKHQLTIIAEYGSYTAYRAVNVRYSYQFSTPHGLREQVVQVELDSLPPTLRDAFEKLRQALLRRVPPPQPVRLPHAEITPTVRETGITVVVQDQQRADEIPHVRMYYLEEVSELQSRQEFEVHMRPGDFSEWERQQWEVIRDGCKRIAWTDYRKLVREHLFP
jgi:hypothetical protein